VFDVTSSKIQTNIF